MNSSFMGVFGSWFEPRLSHKMMLRARHAQINLLMSFGINAPP
jgi:hypothetical protein